MRTYLLVFAALLPGLLFAAFGLALITRLVAGWCCLYTLGLPVHVGEIRRGQLKSDVDEQKRDDLCLGYRPEGIALRIFGRFIAGIPADILWRLSYVSWSPSRTAELSRETLYRYSPLVMLLTSVVMAAVMIPGIGHRDARGFFGQINLGPLPPLNVSEIAKLTIVVYLSAWISSKGNHPSPPYSLDNVSFVTLFGAASGFLVLGGDSLSAISIAFTALAMLWFAGSQIKNIAALALACAFGIGSLLILGSFRSIRFAQLLSIPSLSGQRYINIMSSHVSGYQFILVNIALLVITLLASYMAHRSATKFTCLLGIGVALSLGCQVLLNALGLAHGIPLVSMLLLLLPFGGGFTRPRTRSESAVR